MKKILVSATFVAMFLFSFCVSAQEDVERDANTHEGMAQKLDAQLERAGSNETMAELKRQVKPGEVFVYAPVVVRLPALQVPPAPEQESLFEKPAFWAASTVIAGVIVWSALYVGRDRDMKTDFMR